MRFSQLGPLTDDVAGTFRGGRVAYLREPGGSLVELFQTIPQEGG